MSYKFKFNAQGTNPSSIAMIIGALLIVIGWGAYSIGFEPGWNLLVVGGIFFVLGVFLNLAWINSRRR